MDGPHPSLSSATPVLASVPEATRPSRKLSSTFTTTLIALLVACGVALLFVELPQNAVDKQAAADADPVITASVKPMLPPVRKVVATSVRVAARRAAPAVADEAGTGGDRGILEPQDPRWAPPSNERNA